jgi:uncharacterized glyoxalase superfamily protein PhnB
MAAKRAPKKTRKMKKATTPQARARAGRPRRPVRHEPQSLRLRELAVSLTVADLARSVAWYRDIVGFTEGERWESDGQLRGIQLKAGLVEVMLNQDDGAQGRDRVKGVGVRLWASTVQDVDRLAAEIGARGGVLTDEPGDLPWGGRAFGLTDPDGYRLMVVSAT